MPTLKPPASSAMYWTPDQPDRPDGAVVGAGFGAVGLAKSRMSVRWAAALATLRRAPSRFSVHRRRRDRQTRRRVAFRPFGAPFEGTRRPVSFPTRLDIHDHTTRRRRHRSRRRSPRTAHFRTPPRLHQKALT